MESISVGVVGLGVMGQLFARLLTELPNARLAGVADLNLDKSNTIGQKYGVPAFANVDDLLDETIDAVIITTDEGEHLEPIRSAAQAGKSIFVEKPLATTVFEGQAILQAVAEANVPLMVGHCVRFDPRYAAARTAISRREFGDLVHLTARRNVPQSSPRRLDGRCSVSMFLGIHDIDFLLWVTGQTVTHVYALGRKHLLKDIRVQDSILSVLKFEDGLIASLETSWVSQLLSFKFEAVGANSTLIISTPESGTVQYGIDGSRFANPLYDFTPLAGGNQTFNVYQAELMHFLTCLAEDRPFIIQPEEALQAVAVAEAIDRSVDSGRTEIPEKIR